MHTVRFEAALPHNRYPAGERCILESLQRQTPSSASRANSSKKASHRDSPNKFRDLRTAARFNGCHFG